MELEYVEEPKEKPVNNTSVICRNCGAEDSIIAHYRYTTTGTCNVIRRDGYLAYDDYEDDDFAGGDTDVFEFHCTECDTYVTDINELIEE